MLILLLVMFFLSNIHPFGRFIVVIGDMVGIPRTPCRVTTRLLVPWRRLLLPWR
jgi:hypothetical protein